MTSRYQLTVDMARRDNLTVRQLLLRLGGGRGHRTFTGTPEQVADSLEEWFTTGAADGFNVMPPVLPAGLDAFVEQVVPILQQRGLFRTAYTGTTLREHYGLPVPATGGAGGCGLLRVRARSPPTTAVSDELSWAAWSRRGARRRRTPSAPGRCSPP